MSLVYVAEIFPYVFRIEYYRSGDPNTIINGKDIKEFAPILIETNDWSIIYSDKSIEVMMIDKRKYNDDVYLIKEKDCYTKKAISNK